MQKKDKMSACFQTSQALPPYGSNHTVQTLFTGHRGDHSTRNLHRLQQQRHIVKQSPFQGKYVGSLRCSAGTAVNVNNECVGGLPSYEVGKPYQPNSGASYTATLFSPDQPSLFPPTTSAVKTLIAQRSPLPRGQCNFTDMDMTPW